MKSTYYFSHDSNARHDLKIQALRSVYGIRGYGMYWVVIEMMRENECFKLPLGDKIIHIALSREFECAIEEVKNFINDCIYEFGLFVSNESHFWSDSLIQRMEIAEAKRNANRQNGTKGGRPPSKRTEFTQEETNQSETVDDKQVKQKTVKTENATVAQYSDEVVSLTNLLAAEMLKNNPQAKIPSNKDRWHNDMKLLLTDGYEYKQIEQMILWCQSDDFWKSNILSARKLRDKAGTLVVQMGRKDDAKHWSGKQRPDVQIATFEGYNDIEITPEELEEIRRNAREYDRLRELQKMQG